MGHLFPHLQPLIGPCLVQAGDPLPLYPSCAPVDVFLHHTCAANFSVVAPLALAIKTSFQIEKAQENRKSQRYCSDTLCLTNFDPIPFLSFCSQ